MYHFLKFEAQRLTLNFLGMYRFAICCNSGFSDDAFRDGSIEQRSWVA
jgi:hypothetical protein